jgi:hypothetical protein
MWFPRGTTVESSKGIIIRRKRPEDSVHLRCDIATRSGGNLFTLTAPAAALTASSSDPLVSSTQFRSSADAFGGASAVNPGRHWSPPADPIGRPRFNFTCF